MVAEAVEVAILIVTHNGRKYLEDCLGSVLESDDGPIRKQVILVDNGSTDGTLEYVEGSFPTVERVSSGENLGFSGGNNLGWEHIQRQHPHTAYLCLLNHDTIVESGWLRTLLEYLERHSQAGCVQPKILLHPRTDLINTAGNRCHFLGFGWTTGYREPDQGQYDSAGEIDFASGAALLVRASLLRELALFDPVLFMYLEDVELGWKLRQIGRTTVFVPESRVYHKYAFHDDFRYYYELERNRWWLLLTFYKFATLILLAPALLLMETGQLLFAVRHGRLGDKLRSYRFFLNRANQANLRQRRRAAQARRTVSDHEFLGGFDGRINSPELSEWPIRYVANPIFGAYWWVARRLIFW